MAVEKQLIEILNSKTFHGSEVIPGLLKFIVDKTLDKKALKENHLLLDYFGVEAEQIDNTKARVYSRRLRAKLKVYYASEGIDDLVLIGIPNGQYNAEFSYRSQAQAYKEVILGFHHVDMESPDDIRIALEHFDSAIELEPEYSEGYAGKASALLTMTLHAFREERKALMEQAEAAAAMAVKMNDASWRGHANLGAVFLFRHEWEIADEAFGRAEKLARLEVGNIGAYGPFLVSRGRFDEAVKLAESYVDEGYDDPVLLVRAALYFYVLREFERSAEVLLDAIVLNPHFWRSHLGLVYVYLATREPEKAVSHMLRVGALNGIDLWPGLRIVCLEKAGRWDDAIREFEELKSSAAKAYIQPLQLALGHMALGEIPEAVDFLSKACDEDDPFTAWLHLWPVLDPLKRYPEFRALLRKWRFPVE